MTGVTAVLTWDLAFQLAGLLSAIGTIQHSLELLSIHREFQTDGVFSWRVLRLDHPRVVRSTHGRVIEWWLSPPAYSFVIVCQLLGALAIVSRPLNPFPWALAIVLAGRIVFNFRNSRTLIGADQMQIIVLAACLLQVLVPTRAVTQACAWFVALQLVLSYVTSGAWKLATPSWRRGTALRDIVRTRTMGNPWAYALLKRRPGLSPALCWATIVFECAFPWLLFGGPLTCAILLVAGLVFHVAVAAVMGLEEFVWAFLAAYPLALRCSIQMQAFWSR